MIHRRIRCALTPLICAVFFTGVAAVICIELAGAMSDLPTHVQIMVFAVPVGYWVLSALTFFDVVSKDGAAVLSLVLIPVLIVFIMIEAFIMSLQFPIGVGGIG